MKIHTPTSRPLTLDPPIDNMEISNVTFDSNNVSTKIGGCGPDASQDHGHWNQVVQTRLDAFPSISAEGSHYVNQQNQICEQKIVSGPSRLRSGDSDVECILSCVEPSIPAAVKEYHSNPPDYEHLTIPSSPLDPDLSQTPSPEVAHSGFSHRIDLESCEGLPSLLPESFKSSVGHSDDILPRQIFNGEKENQKADMTTNFSINPENLPHAVNPFTISGLETRDPDSAISGSSLTPTERKDQSHEKTGIQCVSHHSDISLSLPIVQTEYSQSNPYYTPATIFRAHSPDIRTDVVGIQELNSSSPPSSPSMASNYLPTTAPIPGSSPMDGPAQTPPTSSPISGLYDHNLPGGLQEGFYTEETYSNFSQFSMDHRAYQPLHQDEPNNFFVPDPRQHSSTMSHSMIPPPFIQDYFDVTQEIAKNPDPYPPTELNLTASEPAPPISGPSTQKIEPSRRVESASQSQQDQKGPSKNTIPNPKRPTLAGVRQQQKKLSKPFRSPIIHPPVRLAPKPPTKSSEPLVSSANSMFLKEAATASQNSSAASSSSQATADAKMKHRTTRAAAQFKSPLSSSSTSSDEAALVRLTPTIQSLERKLQLLRRALKVREDVQEEVLEGLVNKWSEAGKEVAWEVWDVVKDNANAGEGSGDDKKGKKRAVEENWGWDESPDSKKQKTGGEGEGERNWGWDVVPVAERVEDERRGEAEAESQGEDERTEETQQPSLGTMLLQLGIAPETFGWSEEEGGFVDK